MADKIKVMRCECISSFQDGLYGMGLRVHNVGQGKNTNQAKCTVCGKKKTF